jgi:hypothetical protein
MKKLVGLALLLMLISALVISAWAGEKQDKPVKNTPKDAFGRPDVATVVIKEIAPNHFACVLNWDNDQELAALTYPLRVTGKDFAMRYDSVSWAGRAEYFSVKAVRPEDSIQSVNVGFINDLGQGNPPLKPGSGTVATLFFTADVKEGKANVCDVTVDTVFLHPSNVLYGVTVGATGEIHPEYNLNRVNSEGKPIECK